VRNLDLNYLGVNFCRRARNMDVARYWLKKRGVALLLTVLVGALNYLILGDKILNIFTYPGCWGNLNSS